MATKVPAKDFAHTAATTLGEMIRHEIRAHGECILGLSGGSTPGPVYEALSKEMVDWSRVIIFMIDDRCVSPDHPDSNQYLIRTTLLNRLPQQPQWVVHNTALTPEDATADYNKQLVALFQKRAPDIVVLGMGSDGHIASLFPLLTEEAFGPACAIHTTTEKFAVPHRISVTLPVLTSATHAVFLLKGAEKQALWSDMMNSTEDAHRWPAKAVADAGNATIISGD